MKKINKEKLLSSLTSLFLATSMSGCYYSQNSTQSKPINNAQNGENTTEPIVSSDIEEKNEIRWPVIDPSFTIDSKIANELFYNNKILNVDSVSNNYYAWKLNSFFGGPDNDGYVCEIIKDGKKYLVDASDFTKVYLSDYDQINSPYYEYTLNAYFNGPDNDGYVCEIIKDGKKYLVDASDFTRVYLAEYDQIDSPYYEHTLNTYSGGPDNDGQVREIIKDGKKYLVDASDFTKIYAVDFDYISENKIYMKHASGEVDVQNVKGYKPEKSHVLTKVK